MIEVDQLTKYYGKLLAVDAISFTVNQGEIFGFLGPNGAGKSTTQLMLTTLLSPSSGQIKINGLDLAQDDYPTKRTMGIVPEESNVYTELTAWENLQFTARLYRIPRSQQEQRIQELLKYFGLWEKRSVKVGNFSKGMRRRLCIAMAIIHKPSLLFLDEPTPGLDAQSVRSIHEMIRKLNADGTTIFITTHDIEEANTLCDRVAIIDHGKIAAIDTPEQLKAAFRRVQSVEVAMEASQDLQSEILNQLQGEAQQVKVGDKYRLYTEDPSALVHDIVHAAEERGLRVISLSILGPSLEDVFLKITGQKIGVIPHETNNNREMRGRKKGGK